MLKIIFNSNKSVYDLIIVITTFGIKYSVNQIHYMY